MKSKKEGVFKTILLFVIFVAFCLLSIWIAIDRYKTYQGERLFFQQYYEQHKED